FVASAITPALVKKYENRKIYNFYTIAGAVPYALIFVAYKLSGGNLTTLPWSICLAILIGLAAASMGGINVMQSIMIADCVDYEEYHKGYRPEGVLFSGQSFLTKLAGGIAALIQGVVYTIVHFSGDNLAKINNTLATTDTHFYELDGGKYAAAMFFLISIPIAVGMILSALPMKNYAMTDAEHKQMLDELVERRNSNKENQ
ncbi:MAG: MFS transporter, partial [Eubacterium sp.]|nr:MFS transporter [Eubacterium sp.]